MTDRPSDARRELPKAYAPTEVETAIYQRWLAADVFAPDGAGSRPTQRGRRSSSSSRRRTSPALSISATP